MKNTEIQIKPLVTIAMVTYNSEKYVRMAIDSVLASSYSNFELIISDDCSTDNTWEIIREYNDPRINASRNATNMGEYPNRNKCIDLAKGEYLIFIDGDDIILPIGLETYIHYAQSALNVGMVIQKGYFNNIIFPCKLNSIEIFEWEFGRKSLLTSSFSSNFFITNILKKEGKLSEKLKTGDNDIRYRIAMKYDILFIPGWLTWPRETPGQASTNIDPISGLLESIIRVEFVKNHHSEVNIRKMASNTLDKLKHNLTKQCIKSKILGDGFSKINKEMLSKYVSFYSLVYFKKPNNLEIAYTPDKPYYKIP